MLRAPIRTGPRGGSGRTPSRQAEWPPGERSQGRRQSCRGALATAVASSHRCLFQFKVIKLKHKLISAVSLASLRVLSDQCNEWLLTEWTDYRLFPSSHGTGKIRGKVGDRTLGRRKEDGGSEKEEGKIIPRRPREELKETK